MPVSTVGAVSAGIATDIAIAAEGSGSGSGSGSSIPVPEEVTATNGLRYRSHSKHTPGQAGNRRNASIEPRNSLDLFESSIPSSKNPNVRFTFDQNTKTLHRFFDNENGQWHWSGSRNFSNPGANPPPLTSGQIPIDIKREFNLPRKGW